MVQNNSGVSLAQYAGQRLDSYLYEHKIKLGDFAKRIGVDVRTLQRWRYEGIHSVDTIELIAEMLGVSYMDILS